MNLQELAALERTVLWSVFALTFVLGAVMQRTQFCTMGAVADVLNFGDWTRARQWLLAIGIAVIGTTALAARGWIDLSNSIYTASRLNWLAHLIGGALFGFGMVLAGGCVSRSLVRAGSGSLKSLVVLVVLSMVAFSTLRGVLALPRVNGLETVAFALPARQDLASIGNYLSGAAVENLRLLLGLTTGIAALVFVLRDRRFFTADNLLAGAVVGTAVVALWFVSGHIGHVLEHPQTLEAAYVATASKKMESLTFVAPTAQMLEWLLFASDNKALSFGATAALGTLCGALAVALASQRFRWEGFRDTEDTANHIAGGALMGFGGVTALGCSIGQGITGVSTLAIGSLLALVGIVSGAVLAVRYQTWRVAKVA